MSYETKLFPLLSILLFFSSPASIVSATLQFFSSVVNCKNNRLAESMCQQWVLLLNLFQFEFLILFLSSWSYSAMTAIFFDSKVLVTNQLNKLFFSHHQTAEVTCMLFTISPRCLHFVVHLFMHTRWVVFPRARNSDPIRRNRKIDFRMNNELFT